MPGRRESPWTRRVSRAAGAALGSWVLRASRAATRLQVTGEEIVADSVREHGAVVFAVWHGRFWLPAACFGRWGTTLLVSRSEDGEVIARIAERLGFRTVRGSSSRGGREGLEALAGAVTTGRSVALTPDGPRGPRHRAQMGTVALAARTGCPVIPVGAAASPAWTFRSWDRFQVPLPVARGAVVFTRPFPVPREDDLEPWRVRLEDRLNEAESEADRRVGLASAGASR